eukprot:11896227-Karenia_brevis.AAC.1
MSRYGSLPWARARLGGGENSLRPELIRSFHLPSSGLFAGVQLCGSGNALEIWHQFLTVQRKTKPAGHKYVDGNIGRIKSK